MKKNTLTKTKRTNNFMKGFSVGAFGFIGAFLGYLYYAFYKKDSKEARAYMAVGLGFSVGFILMVMLVVLFLG